MLKAAQDSPSRDDFFREAAVMSRLRHPRLVSLIGVVTAEEPIMMVVDLMARGSLLKILRAKQNGQDLYVIAERNEEQYNRQCFPFERCS